MDATRNVCGGGGGGGAELLSDNNWRVLFISGRLLIAMV
jgi:hypothetical protein